MLSKAASPLLLSTLFAHLLTASPITKRQDDNDVTTQASTSLNVTTETDLTWCRPYADEMGDVVTYYYEPTPITVTCWAQTTMNDEKGQVNGDGIYLKEDNGCWINQEYVQGGDIDFTSALNECDAPAHQVGYPKDSYYVDGQGIKCYNGTSATAGFQYVSIGYIDLGCGTQGAAVNGNSTWVKWAKGQCYFPGDTFNPTEFHGYSVGTC